MRHIDGGVRKIPDDFKAWARWPEDGSRVAPSWKWPERYPRLFSASVRNASVSRHDALESTRTEYVTFRRDAFDDRTLDMITGWNVDKAAAIPSRTIRLSREFPSVMRNAVEGRDINVMFVPRTQDRFFEYAPLFHLLPGSTLERHGLPYLSWGHWPHAVDTRPCNGRLARDFPQRLARAWAYEIWRHMMSGSPPSRFTDVDPIRILAHNLDFWIPPVTEAMQRIIRGLDTLGSGVAASRAIYRADGLALQYLWVGEEEAKLVIGLVVKCADATGNLRAILDAVRSNRVEDDFSDRWSFAKEDFERKLFKKRSKVQVRFVELTDTIPVHGPETEVVGNTVTADFMALLDEKNRQIVVLLNSGYTSLTDIGEIMGYADHSPISKRLGQIRKTAERFFDV